MNTPLNRREFLRAAGVSLALPLSGIDRPPGRRPRDHRRGACVAMNFALGIHGPNFFPQEPGRDYASTPYLEALGSDLRDRLTIVSGTSHPDVTLGPRQRLDVPDRRPIPRCTDVSELDLARPVRGRKAPP